MGVDIRPHCEPEPFPAVVRSYLCAMQIALAKSGTKDGAKSGVAPMVLSMDSMLLPPKAKARYSDDIDVAGDPASEDAADRLPQEILLLVLQRAVACAQPRGGGPLGSLLACRLVCRRWRHACSEDGIVASAATLLTGRLRLTGLLLATPKEAEKAMEYGQTPSYACALKLLTDMRASQEGSFTQRLARKAKRKRQDQEHPSAVSAAVKKRMKMIETSRRNRCRKPEIKEYKQMAHHWYGWWTPEIATKGAEDAYSKNLDPMVGTHIDYLMGMGLGEEVEFPVGKALNEYLAEPLPWEKRKFCQGVSLSWHC